MAITFKLRRGYAAEWTAKNPTLQAGEPGFEIDTRKLKVGNGVLAWNSLPYIGGAGGGGDVIEHIDSETPHPVYDDGPSLFLLYENAKV